MKGSSQDFGRQSSSQVTCCDPMLLQLWEEVASVSLRARSHLFPSGEQLQHLPEALHLPQRPVSGLRVSLI